MLEAAKSIRSRLIPLTPSSLSITIAGRREIPAPDCCRRAIQPLNRKTLWFPNRTPWRPSIRQISKPSAPHGGNSGSQAGSRALTKLVTCRCSAKSRQCLSLRRRITRYCTRRTLDESVADFAAHHLYLVEQGCGRRVPHGDDLGYPLPNDAGDVRR